MSLPNIAKFKAILFDLDGVLVDSYECWFHMLRDALMFQNKPPITRQEFHAAWGQGVEDDRRMFFPEWTFDAVLDYYNQNFSKYTGALIEIPGARSLLRAIHQSGKKIAVASNSPSLIISHLLSARDMMPFVDIRVGIDEVANGKPEPDLILRAMERLDVSKTEACYIGDSIFDETAARSAGVHFIGYQRDGDERIENLADLMPGL